jgi:antitoxin component YwqK of YwqJK toxin-antitoxin module
MQTEYIAQITKCKFALQYITRHANYVQYGYYIECIQLNQHNILHGIYGPAIVRYRPNGIISAISYYINGEQHNEHGPAIVGYNLNGAITYTAYYINGKKQTTQWFIATDNVST